MEESLSCCAASRDARLHVLIQKAERSPNLVNLKNVLHFVRSEKMQRSDLEFKYGQMIIAQHSRALGDDVWLMLETTLIAALHSGHDNEAEGFLARLQRKFPESKRVSVLQGMLLEARERYPEALEIYDKVLKEQPTHMTALKRRIAAVRSQGDTSRAVRLLNDYVELYYADESAWITLYQIYLESGALERARFCLEELLLMQPLLQQYSLRYAEICYSLGSSDPVLGDGIAEARRYFARSVLLKPPRPDLDPELPVIGSSDGSREMEDGGQIWGVGLVGGEIAKELENLGLRECDQRQPVHNLRGVFGLYLTSRETNPRSSSGGKPTGSFGGTSMVRDLEKRSRATLLQLYSQDMGAPPHLCGLIQRYLEPSGEPSAAAKQE